MTLGLRSWSLIFCHKFLCLFISPLDSAGDAPLGSCRSNPINRPPPSPTPASAVEHRRLLTRTGNALATATRRNLVHTLAPAVAKPGVAEPPVKRVSARAVAAMFATVAGKLRPRTFTAVQGSLRRCNATATPANQQVTAAATTVSGGGLSRHRWCLCHNRACGGCGASVARNAATPACGPARAYAHRGRRTR